MRKRVFWHTRTAKALIRLRGCAVWSGPSLSAYKISGYYRMYKWRGEGPDNTLRMRRRIWICAFCVCSKAPFLLTRPIQLIESKWSEIRKFSKNKEQINWSNDCNFTNGVVAVGKSIWIMYSNPLQYSSYSLPFLYNWNTAIVKQAAEVHRTKKLKVDDVDYFPCNKNHKSFIHFVPNWFPSIPARFSDKHSLR